VQQENWLYAEPWAARTGVEHGTVGMLDHHERCHGFEHRDFYLLTFAGFSRRYAAIMLVCSAVAPATGSAMTVPDGFSR
jgi:hypothetical protein